MGALISTFWRLFGSKEYKIVIVGLDNAGKTTILYTLHLHETVVTQPTIGSNVEEIQYHNLNLMMWDLGGQAVQRESWKMYFINTQAVIMVVDSTDLSRMDTVKEELFALLEHPDLKDSCVLVYANKQDLEDAAGAGDLAKLLNLDKIRDHPWHIQACSALKGEGLNEGLDWVVDRLKEMK